MNFDATAHSLGDLRKIELWVDGKKLGEQYHTWEGNGFFNLDSNFNAGTHNGTYFAAGIDNTLLQYNFTFSVPSSCSAPSTAGVHICWPTNGANINSTSVLVDATSNVTGTLARMEVWVDSVKKYTETDSPSLSTAVAVTPGTHDFTVFAVNTSGTVWSETTSATNRRPVRLRGLFGLWAPEGYYRDKKRPGIGLHGNCEPEIPGLLKRCFLLCLADIHPVRPQFDAIE